MHFTLHYAFSTFHIRIQICKITLLELIVLYGYEAAAATTL